MSPPEWEALIVLMRPRMVRKAFSIIGDEHEAEDATQEALVAALDALPTLRDPKAVHGWLLVIVGNRSLTRRRVREKHRELCGLAVDGPSGMLPEPADHRPPELHACVELCEAVDGLTPVLRRTIQQEFSGLSTMQIAESEGISYGTARTRVSRARASVREAVLGGRP